MSKKIWNDILLKLVEPVLVGFANKNIKDLFKSEFSPFLHNTDKFYENIVYIELFCRTILGVAPILEHNEYLLELTLKSFDNCFSGYINWYCGEQLLVEIANLSLGFLRCPILWDRLKNKKNILSIIKKTSIQFKPHPNNWILFKCIIDIFLYKNNEINDIRNVKQYLKYFEKDFYIGDGWYKDGKIFHMDYYNSYVIHPFLAEIYKELKDPIMLETINTRLKRQSEFLERLISADGTFPLFGRSMVYRTAIFHALVYACYNNILPDSLTYSQVRCSLTEVIKKMFNNENNFDEHGFLQIGFMSHQPELADSYSNKGSLYFALLVFMPLGLKDDHQFWTEEEKEWTQVKAWNGNRIIKDQNMK
jgi:hypothetical protein